MIQKKYEHDMDTNLLLSSQAKKPYFYYYFRYNFQYLFWNKFLTFINNRARMHTFLVNFAV